MSKTGFLFACCQVGAEAALKCEMQQQWPESRFAFSRPGFLTFKMGGEMASPERIQLKSVFARTFGLSIGPIDSGESLLAIERLRDAAGEAPFHALHVWPRDTQIPGQNGFVPGATPEAEALGAPLLAEGVRRGVIAEKARVNGTARVGQRVSDLILLDPDRWWLGWHVANCFVHRWPGGVLPVARRKTWFHGPISRRAKPWPGPACRSVPVIAAWKSAVRLVDPARRCWNADCTSWEWIHRKCIRRCNNIRTLLMCGNEVPTCGGGELRGCKWMVVDSNVAPQHTLDTVEALVTHPATSFQGLLLTLKFPEWKLADRVGEYAERVRSWGFSAVRCRQLAYQRQEICLAALRHRTLRRLPRRKSQGP